MKINRDANPIDILLAIFFLTVVFLASNVYVLDREAVDITASYEVIR